MEKAKLNRRTFSAILLIISVAILFSCNRASVASGKKAPAVAPAEGTYIKDELIVSFREDVADDRIKEIISGLGCDTIRNSGPDKTFLVRIKAGASVKDMIEKFIQFDEIKYAEPNYIYRIQK